MKRFAIAGYLFATIFQLHSQGYIVPNGVTQVPNSIYGDEFHVLQTPSGDYTAFLFTLSAANTFQFQVALDGGVRVFLVSPYDPISLQPILSQNYTELLSPGFYGLDAGIPFYVGLYTGYPTWDSNWNYTGIYTDPLFGWGELINNNGVIQLLDSALEYGGGGIIAGTQTILPVPEPGTMSLLLLGASLLGLRHRRSRHHIAATTVE